MRALKKIRLIANKQIINTNRYSSEGFHTPRSAKGSLVETAAGVLILIFVALFLFDLVSMVLVQTANDSLAKHAARVAAGQSDPHVAYLECQNVVTTFPNSAMLTNPQLVLLVYTTTKTTTNSNNSTTVATTTYTFTSGGNNTADEADTTSGNTTHTVTPPGTTTIGGAPASGISQVYVRTQVTCVLPIPVPLIHKGQVNFVAEATEPIVAVLPP